MLRPLYNLWRVTVPRYRECSVKIPSLHPRLLLHTSQSVLGPGADRAYKSEEEREAEEKATRKKRQRLMFGVVAGLAGGTLYAYSEHRRKKNVKEIANDASTKEYLLSEPPPDFPPSRSIVNPEDKTGLKITLFQYQTCPFCCKARVFLDYFGFSYDVIEVNSVLRKQVKWSKYKKVPILVAKYGDKVIQVNDSSVIVSALFSLLADSGETNLETVMDYFPTLRYMDEDGKEKSEIQNKYFLMYNETKLDRTKENIVEERRWRRWVDDTLVHTLSPNVYRTWTEALEAFKWFSEVGDWDQHFSWWERNLVIYVGAIAMLFIGKRLKKRHNLKDDVRSSLYDECNLWAKAIKKKGTPYMGGLQPNLSDLAVYGVLNAIQGCEAWKDTRANSAIGDWFDRMTVAVKEREGRHMVAGWNVYKNK